MNLLNVIVALLMKKLKNDDGHDVGANICRVENKI